MDFGTTDRMINDQLNNARRCVNAIIGLYDYARRYFPAFVQAPEMK